MTRTHQVWLCVIKTAYRSTHDLDQPNAGGSGRSSYNAYDLGSSCRALLLLSGTYRVSSVSDDGTI